MARRETPRRLQFDPKGPLITRRAFKFGGRPYEVGDPFDHRRANCAPRMLRSLFLKGNLQHPADFVPDLDSEPEKMDVVTDKMSMDKLREVAKKEGAESANTKAALVDNIIANRKAKTEE